MLNFAKYLDFFKDISNKPIALKVFGRRGLNALEVQSSSKLGKVVLWQGFRGDLKGSLVFRLLGRLFGDIIMLLKSLKLSNFLIELSVNVRALGCNGVEVQRFSLSCQEIFARIGIKSAEF